MDHILSDGQTPASSVGFPCPPGPVLPCLAQSSVGPSSRMSIEAAIPSHHWISHRLQGLIWPHRKRIISHGLMASSGYASAGGPRLPPPLGKPECWEEGRTESDRNPLATPSPQPSLPWAPTWRWVTCGSHKVLSTTWLWSTSCCPFIWLCSRL